MRVSEIDTLVHVTRAAQIMLPWMRVSVLAAPSCPAKSPYAPLRPAVTHCCALSKLKSCSTKLWPTISSKTKDLPDFETIMLSASVNRIK